MVNTVYSRLKDQFKRVKSYLSIADTHPQSHYNYYPDHTISKDTLHNTLNRDNTDNTDNRDHSLIIQDNTDNTDKRQSIINRQRIDKGIAKKMVRRKEEREKKEKQERKEKEEDMMDSLYLLDKRECDSSVTIMKENHSSRKNRSILNMTYSNQSDYSQPVVKKLKTEVKREGSSLLSKVELFKQKVAKQKARQANQLRPNAYQMIIEVSSQEEDINHHHTFIDNHYHPSNNYSNNTQQKQTLIHQLTTIEPIQPNKHEPHSEKKQEINPISSLFGNCMEKSCLITPVNNEQLKEQQKEKENEKEKEKEKEGGFIMQFNTPQEADGLFGTKKQKQQEEPVVLLNDEKKEQSIGLFSNKKENEPVGLFGNKIENNSVGLFGNKIENDTGLFGNKKENDSTGLFGDKKENDSTGLFGNKQEKVGLFSDKKENNSVGLFGNKIENESTGLFGNKKETESTGLFGNKKENESTGLFGNKIENSQVGLFGNKIENKKEEEKVSERKISLDDPSDRIKQYNLITFDQSNLCSRENPFVKNTGDLSIPTLENMCGSAPNNQNSNEVQLNLNNQALNINHITNFDTPFQSNINPVINNNQPQSLTIFTQNNPTLTANPFLNPQNNQLPQQSLFQQSAITSHPNSNRNQDKYAKQKNKQRINNQ